MCNARRRDYRGWQRASINNNHEVENVGVTGCFIQVVNL